MRKYDKMYHGTGGTWQGIINHRRNLLRQKAAEQLLWRMNNLDVSDRFSNLALCAHYRYRMRILGLNPKERRAHMAMWRLHLHYARYECPRPRLP